MQIEFDPAKDEINRAKHGVPMNLAAGLEWDTAITWLDTREDYGEDRQCGIGYIGLTLYFVAFVDRESAVRRIISLRRANKREENRYAKT
jgi:uncharacterized DUF497 family protein